MPYYFIEGGSLTPVGQTPREIKDPLDRTIAFIRPIGPDKLSVHVKSGIFATNEKGTDASFKRPETFVGSNIYFKNGYANTRVEAVVIWSNNPLG